MWLLTFFKKILTSIVDVIVWVSGNVYRVIILALLVFIILMYIGQWSRDKQIKNLDADLNKSKGEYKLLLGQHKNLADAVGIQNAAINKMKIDEVKAEKQFQIAKMNIKNKYEDLVAKYKDAPEDKECAIITERNQKYYEEDKGVGYEN